MEEINKTLEQAYHRVQSKVDVLEASLRDFTDATLGLSRWYEGGDILCKSLLWDVSECHGTPGVLIAV